MRRLLIVVCAWLIACSPGRRVLWEELRKELRRRRPCSGPHRQRNAEPDSVRCPRVGRPLRAGIDGLRLWQGGKPTGVRDPNSIDLEPWKLPSEIGACNRPRRRNRGSEVPRECLSHALSEAASRFAYTGILRQGDRDLALNWTSFDLSPGGLGDPNAVGTADWSPDGRYLAYAGPASIRIFDIAANSSQALAPRPRPRVVSRREADRVSITQREAVSGDGRW